MDVRRVEDLLNQIDEISRRIEGREPGLAADAAGMRDATSEIRREVAPPEDDDAPRTRDQISPREWAEYEWVDVTSMGDRQRKYVRGLKR